MSRDLEVTLRAVVSSISDGIYMTDADGFCIAFNDAFLRITGISVQIFGRHVSLLLEEGLISDSVTLESIQTGQRVSKVIIYPSGCEALVTGNPVFDENGSLHTVVCEVRDLSELNTIKNELKQTKLLNQQYKRLLENYHSAANGANPKIVVRDPKMQAILDLLPRIADSDVTVLICGESGVGKGLIASLIHEYSSRSSKGQLLKVDCSAIPSSLLESELFGYEGGAFTGARREGKPGLLELADHGTVFLDEIGELPLFLQVKLLNVLQERTIFRIGGTKQVPLDIRIIGATNRDLEHMVDEGTFRQDLYYRLNVVPIVVPPLRERRGDIMALLLSSVDRFREKYNRSINFAPEALDCLFEYAWPGNVRELENTVERLVVLSPDGLITLDDLPENIRRTSGITGSGPLSATLQIISLKKAVALTEKNLIEKALEQENRLLPAAQALEIDVSTLLRKCKKLGIKRADILAKLPSSGRNA